MLLFINWKTFTYNTTSSTTLGKYKGLINF